jgi:serine/threonine protein kinase
MIAGRYEPLEPLRPGAPRRARDLQTAQTVWLREIEITPDERGVAAAARARAAKGLIHPSVLALFDVIEQPPDRLLLSYEFVPAQPILQVSGGGPLNPRRAVELMSEIADGVAALHARGVIHGAITLDNVLVTLKGKAKLDRAGDPSLPLPESRDERADIAGVVAVLRELIRGAQRLPALDRLIRQADQGIIRTAAVLAASLRLAVPRP